MKTGRRPPAFLLFLALGLFLAAPRAVLGDPNAPKLKDKIAEWQAAASLENPGRTP